MNHQIKYKLLLSVFFVFFLTIYSCKKEKKAKGTDKELFDMAKETNGFTWFKLSDTLLPKSSGSGHPQALLRTRYNSIASTNLDSNGRVKNSNFPEGSLIVKELHENIASLSRYAILYKKSGHSDADSKGWVWGYINSNGTVAEAADKKGKSCIGCHSQADNIDYMLMNKFYQ